MASWKVFIIVGLSLAALAVSACNSNRSRSATAIELPPPAEMATMPSEVQTAAEPIAFAYRFAATSPDILKQIPCYCGCAPMGHDSNYACFWTEDGALEPHGLNCGICIYTARDVRQGLEKGRTLAEIRAQVDADYARYGPSTDTPPVIVDHE